nr:alpha/beta fold hydrolase [Sphingosinithalassobacter tenebrarum]
MAWRELGEGRPVVLIHGLFSNAWTNWVRYGHADAVAAKGFRVIMPELRAHGASAAPHDAAAYPPDALSRDNLALVEHLGLTDYDLGGYSLGARTTVRMLATGATPRRVVLGGMGLTGMTDTGARAGHFRNVLANYGNHERGTPEWMAEAFLKTVGGDPEALIHIVDTFVDTSRAELAKMSQPTLVVCAEDDDDNGSASELAAWLPEGKYVVVPGNHMSAIVNADFGEAIADFLAA